MGIRKLLIMTRIVMIYIYIYIIYFYCCQSFFFLKAYVTAEFEGEMKKNYIQQ